MKKHFIFLCFLLTTGYLYGQDLAATTSVLSSIIREIGGGKIAVATLVPPGSCPGHFDLKVNDLKTIENSGILFAHGFEEYLKDITSAVKIPKFKPVIVEIKGSWLVPENQKEAYLKISSILSEKFPRHRGFFEQNREKAEEEINKTDKEIKKTGSERKLKGTPAICNSHIREVLEYTGFEVVADYGRKEELTPAEIKNLIKLCIEKKVRIVIDNLQAGPDTGRVIADELKIPHTAISNFPDVLPGTPTLRHTLLEDVKRIIDAYESAQNTTH
ncbi:MAG: zinc ABC transporter substrate-binding protein [Candidatus Omnitrophica bacterium]|nr:zinc ABC transporter substrate-binding protein [Candidatus Omnitrophota bacterium]